MTTSESLVTPRSPRNKAPYAIPYQNINVNLTPAPEFRSVSTQPRPPVAEWALALRGRIDQDVSDGLRASAEDISDLVEEVCAVFITALQKNRVSDWRYVKDVLSLLQPYARYLKHNQQITHYVDRVYYHLQQYSDKLESLNVMDAIIEVFPEDVKYLLPSGGDGRNYRTPTPPLIPTPSLPYSHNPMLLPNGADPYKLEQPGEEAKLKPRGLCIGDLKDALPVVVLETTKREAVWSEGLGLTAAALAMDLPSKPKPAVVDEIIDRSTVPSEAAPSWTKEAVFFQEDQFNISEHDADEFIPPAPMTGKEAVELFGQGRHLGMAKFVYLNKTPNRHYRPYDLTAVPKHKANPDEHWIVSCFGIMHKVAGKPAQGKALYEWHREAVLWAAISKIPFYKYYLVKKALIRWRANHKFNEYAKIRDRVTKSLLPAVPSFGAAMLQISKLLNELITVRMVPLELDRCYTLAEFEQAAQNKRKYGENILGKFFSYCKLIVEKTCEDSFETLRFCEAQAKKDKALFSKESLYIQRQKKEQRELNLQKAQEETRRLGNLVQLIDKMLLCHLLAVTRTNITTFVEATMCEGISPNRDALFVVKLIFSPKSSLTLFPTKDQFSGTLVSILRDIPTLISEMAQPMEYIAQGWIGHQDEEDTKDGAGRVSNAGSPRSTTSPNMDRTPTAMSKLSNKSKLHPSDETASTMPPESRITMATRSIAGWTSLGAGVSRADEVLTEVDGEEEEEEESGGQEQDATDISEPILPEKVKPSKESDAFGVATPDLCVKGDLYSDLTVRGRGLVGQFNPLESGNLLARLSTDEVVCEALQHYQLLMESAMKDIDKFCEDQAWLTEIHQFTKTWDPRAVTDWKRAQAYTIETKLGEIRSWMERVRNVDRGFTTKNGLFHVDCGAIQEDIVPALMSAFKDLLNFTAGEARKFSMAFINEVKAVVDGMKEKDTNMSAFANYAQQYSTYKNKMPDLQKEVEYIKSLFEVIRLSYRSLNIEEEKCEEKVWQSWEAFLLQLQDAAEFVNTQTPIQLGALQDTFQKLKKDAERISSAASSGPFLDPTENSTALLATIKEYFEQFYNVQSQMMECSKYKEKITGEPYNTSRLAEMLQKMKVRAELWKYVEVSSHAIKDWKNRIFKKWNVAKALDKVTEWQQAAGQLKQYLPQGDQVLAYWYRLLSDFKQDLPLLVKLSSDALKPRHWKALFVSLGQVYQPAKMHTVSELISFNLPEHSMQINSICAGAAAEFALEQSLIRLRKLWEEKEFKLAKHIPNVKQKKVSLVPEKQKKGNKKAIREYAVHVVNTADVPDMFILIGADELQYILEDNLVTLQSMLVSPHLADLRTEAEVWSATLRQIEDLLDVWMHCQTKWQYLGHVFSDGRVKEKFPDLAARYGSVDLKYQDIMKAIANDPKVLSILAKRKGQKGWRELQGEFLREIMVQLIKDEEEILKDLESVLNDTRTAFPRFFFLSNEEVIDILCMTRDKRRWLPAVKKVFCGIENLIFDLPPSKDDIKTAFDINLNADRLQVVAVEGILGEQVTLMSPLTPKFSPINWFSGLERNVKTAVGSLLQACMETRLRNGLKAPENILEELSVLDRNTPEPIMNSKEQKKLKSAVKRSFRHWLLRFPVQCVVTAEAVLWEREMLAVLEGGDKNALKELRDQHQVRLDQYTAILRDNCGSYMGSESRARLQVLLAGLLTQYLHQRDITDALLSLPEPNDKVFDWLKMLRYHMETATVRSLVAKPQEDRDGSISVPLPTIESVQNLKPQTPIPVTSTTSHVFGPCTVQHLNASFAYEYEYLGPATRLAATPLTDRCHLTLTMAMQSNQCGTVIGPSETGKSETITELAKIMGRQLFSFDCTEASNISLLNQQLCGVVQSGCWAVFTNIQHMKQGLMSVFGQHIQYICQAYSVLQYTGNQYGSRTKTAYKQPKSKSRQRRHSVTSLHSLPNSTRLTSKQNAQSTQLGCIPQLRHRRHSTPSREQDPYFERDFSNDDEQIPLFESNIRGSATSHDAMQTDHTEDDFSPLLPFTHKPVNVGHLKFNGMLMKAQPHFGCFLTMNTGTGTKHALPQTLRRFMRPVAMVTPDLRIILETVLHCQGFVDAQALAGKMCAFAELLEAHYPTKYSFGLRAMKSAIDIATQRMYSRRQVYQLCGRDSSCTDHTGIQAAGSDDPLDYMSFGNDEDHKEEGAMVFAIQAVLLPHLGSSDQLRAIRNLLRSIFPWGGGSRPGTAHENDPVLTDAIQNQFVADKLQATPKHVAKVLELYESLQHNSGVILVGPAGSGKTVCYETLSRVLNNLHFSQPVEDRITSPMKGPTIQSASGTPEPRQRSAVTDKVRRTAELVSKVTMQWTDTVNKHAQEKVYSRVDMSVLFPGALSIQELMGYYNEDQATWHDGILSRLTRNATTASKAAKHFVEEQTEKKNKILLNPPSIIDQWIVLDGELSHGWSEGVGPWLGQHRGGVTLGHGEQLKLAESTSLIFETMDLTMASPAMVTRCAVVHLNSEVVHWKCLVESWMGSAKSFWEVNNDSIDLLKALISDTFGPTLDFISNHCNTALNADLLRSHQTRHKMGDGIQEVASFLRILSALCDKHFTNDELMEPGEHDTSDPHVASISKRLSVPDVQRRRASSMGESLMIRPNPMTLVSSVFAFAYVWAFGGHLHNRYSCKFDQFAREQLGKATNNIHFPSDGLVYDYCIDPNLGLLVPWGDKNQDRVKTLPSNYTIIPEVERYSGLLDILISGNHPVLLTGPPGVGKTALMQNLVQPKHYFLKTNLSPGLTCQSFEDVIVSKLRPRSVAMTAVAGTKQPKGGITHLFFIDDLHCGKMDADLGTQPCIEVLRQLMTTGGVYDRIRLYNKALESANFIAACVPPSTVGTGSGTSSHVLSPRITRLFSVVSFFVHSDEAMQLMHGSSLQGWLEEFPAYSVDHHKEMAQALLSATLKLHTCVVKKLPSSPINPQYIFSQHDIHRIIQGLYLMSPRARARPRHGGGGGRRGGGGGRPQGAGGRRIGRPGADRQANASVPPMMRAVVRLWCHEATRTYCDRIISEDDQSWFSQTLLETIEKHFCTGQDLQPDSQLLLLRENSVASSNSEFSEASRLSLSALEIEPIPADPSDQEEMVPSPVDLEQSRKDILSREDSKLTINTTTTDTTTGTQSTPYTEDEDDDDEEDDNDNTRSGASSVTGANSTDGSTLEESQQLNIDPTPPAPSPLHSGLRQPSPPSSPPPSKMLQPTPPPQSSSPGPLLPARKDASPSRAVGRRKAPAQVGRRRTVTFQLSHLSDGRGQDIYTGPLMSMEQILEPGENPCDIIFAKNISSSQGDGRGYIECREEQMYEGLQKTLSQYNSSSLHRMELVFFKEAVRHIARLSRVLAIHSANALLISLANGTGRSNLTFLAAYAARCKMFDASSQQDKHSDEKVYRAWVRDYIKKASHVAGLAGKPAVLFVRGRMPTDCLQDVCDLMNQGTCPDLYTQVELDQISTQMLPGSKVTGQRSQRLEMALERFFKKVMLNLHVVIALDCTAGSLIDIHQKLQEFPTLLNGCCCVDIYRPWSHEALVHVAEQWLRVPTADVHTLLPYKIPWSSDNVDSQVTALSHAMAYMYQTAVFSVKKMYQQHFKLFSPLTYLEFIDLFKNLACKIGRDERTTINKYEEALDKLDDAFDSIDNYNKELGRLRPQHEQALTTAELRLGEVEECKAILAAARDDCRDDEKDITAMQAPLDDMKEQAQAELDKVNPIYEAALHALRSLNMADLDEIRTYNAPPMSVIKVINAICLMFREPYDWQSGKSLINRQNFFQELEFYDKANMPEDIYHKLNILFIQDPDFKPDFVKKASKAATSLCMWVHAVYAYASLHRNMRPKLNDVEVAEAKLQEAQGHLGQKRVKAQDVKGVLEEKNRLYKESIRHVRKLEHAIKNVQNKIATATNLMTNMSAQHSTWKFNLDQAQNNLTTAPGDALLTAACVCFQGPMKEKIRSQVFADWLQRCRSGNFSIVPEERKGAVSGLSSAVSPALDQVISANTSQYLASSRNTSATESRSTSNVNSRITSAIESSNSGGQTSGSRMSMDDSESLSSEVLLLAPDNSNSSPNSSRLASRLRSAAGVAVYPVPIRESFTIEAILSNAEEQLVWKETGMCRDLVATHSALFMRTCCIGRKRQWPLILDPDDQVTRWVKLLQEKEVISFHEEERSDSSEESQDEDVDLNDKLLQDHGLQEADIPCGDKPVSRGTTMGTLSEHGGSSGGTDFHGTPRTLTSYGAETPFKESMNDVDLHDLLATSHVSKSTKTPFDINLDIDRPDNNLWIIPADDPNLEIKIIQAVVMGICLVITHIERKSMDVQFNQLIARNVIYDQGGKRKMVIGGSEFEYNPRFKLYLCSSVPLELTGAGLMSLPIQQTAVIDMSVSPQGITDHLLRDVLAFEKPELEGQWRSIEKDIRDQEMSLQQADEEVLAMILDLPHGILEESTMLETLQEYQQMTLTTEATLLESQQLAKQHHLKQSFYVPVAEHGTLLYSIIKNVSELHPLYHTPLADFVTWFHDIVWSHQKDSTNISSPKARAMELTNSLTRRIHERVSLGLFQPHSQLFALLLAVEKMRLATELTNQEWDLFVHGLDAVTMEMQGSNQQSYPEWMTEQMMQICNQLETFMLAFKGLRDSLNTNSTQWKEYLQCDPVLLAPVPGENLIHLTVMQKALLWRFLKPSKLSQICSDLTVYQLGAHISRPNDYSIEEVISHSHSTTPVVFVLPSDYAMGDDVLSTGFQGHTPIYPTQALLNYAKHHGIDGDVHVVNLGTARQMQRILQVVKECMESGMWIVLENCQLAGQWSQQMMDCIQELITSRKPTPIMAPRKPPHPPSAKQKANDEDTEEQADIATPRHEKDAIHQKFRLFLVTTADSPTPLPGLIVQHGMPVSCETTVNFKSALRTNFNFSMKTMEKAQQSMSPGQKTLNEIVFSVAFLHTILSHRRLYHHLGFSKDYQWSLTDLTSALNVIQTIYEKDKENSVMLTEIRYLLTNVVYGGCVDSEQDLDIIQAMVENCIVPWLDAKMMPSSMGIPSLLAALSRGGQHTSTSRSHGGRRSRSDSSAVGQSSSSQARRFQRMFDSMKNEVQAPHLGMMSSTPDVIEERNSRLISACLHTLHTSPSTKPIFCQSVIQMLHSLLQAIQDMPSINPPPSDSLSHLQNFFANELSCYCNLLTTIQSDVGLLLQATSGLVALTPTVQTMLLALGEDSVPQSWLPSHIPSYTGIHDWLSSVKQRMDILQGLCKEDMVGGAETQEAFCYNMAVFWNPKLFVKCVLQEHARKEYIEVYKLLLEAQILGSSEPPQSPPEFGAYITGLQLHNADWDPHRASIQLSQTKDNDNKPRHTTLPIVWLKPTVPSLISGDITRTHNTYACPVYASEVHTEELLTDDVVLNVGLPCTLDESTWAQKRVYAVTTL